MTIPGTIALVLAGAPALLTAANLLRLRTPPPGAAAGGVSILIPARDEASNIVPAVRAALAAAAPGDGTVEVIVGDDHSTDATAALVEALAHEDPRVRLLAIPALPDGWTGKVHACHHLAQAARGGTLLFVDADVRLAPGAIGRLAGHMARHRLALLSAVPRQRMRTLGEWLTVPAINLLICAYLPVGLMRRRPNASLGAACGQLLAVDRDAYERSGGHRAIRDKLHDGLQLARLIRAGGGRTDLVGGWRLAECRMYHSLAEAWPGVLKNAHEGMATPRGLPVWTLLLAGGHILPPVLALSVPGPLTLAALAASLGTRLAITLRTGEALASVVVHPLTCAVILVIQWQALLLRLRRRSVSWKDRRYGTQGSAAP